jgi:nucleoside phosphorylase
MIAVEMEGFGLARATESILNPTKSIMIKCVMDNTRAKKDIAKAYAAYVSAKFVKKMIEKNILA